MNDRRAAEEERKHMEMEARQKLEKQLAKDSKKGMLSDFPLPFLEAIPRNRQVISRDQDLRPTRTHKFSRIVCEEDTGSGNLIHRRGICSIRQEEFHKQQLEMQQKRSETGCFDR